MITDRLYSIKKFDYVKDLDRNMLELYIVLDEDLILYLDSIPKLEPKIWINIDGEQDFYAVVDSISNVYTGGGCPADGCAVFLIDTDIIGIHFDYVTFPRSGIKSDYTPEQIRSTTFNGSDLMPPLSYYNPLLRDIVQFHADTDNHATDTTTDGVGEGGGGIVIAGKNKLGNSKLCKAEQLTEPPLANLTDVTPRTCGGGKCSVIEHFDGSTPVRRRCDTTPTTPKKKKKKCNSSITLNLDYILLLLTIFGVFFAMLNYIHQHNK